jgi:geranylgeranyl diphosphate synthase type II
MPTTRTRLTRSNLVPSKNSTTASAFRALLQKHQQRSEQVLRRVLRSEINGQQVPPRLAAAMRYAVLNGGKRLRPLLAYASAEALGAAPEQADIPAAAIELIHAYSLIHDDLPAMDDDVLRRGLPTCHVAFDEATAILAGDALQALAFELLAASRELASGDRIRLQMLSELARASGQQGMVGGQAIDIAAAGSMLDEASLGHMHRLKTGALITASVLLGALSSNVATPAQLEILRRFAGLAGLAFQIRDDILDVVATTAVTGKQQGKDARLNKPTYTSLLGLDGARQRLQETLDQALATLGELEGATDTLVALTRYLVERES